MNLKKIEDVAAVFSDDIEGLNRELKRVQSIKCRLKRQKGKKTYQEEMTEVLQYEQVLKEAKNLAEPKKKSVTEFTQEDVDTLDYDETVKAIRSIQSKKTLTKWMTGIEGDNDEYRKAVSIEKMLVAHRDEVRPVDEGHIRKTDLMKVIETIESSGDLSQKKILNLLKKLV